MTTRPLISAGLLVVISCSVLHGVAAPSPDGSAAQLIALTNYEDGETIRYPVPIIRGELADRSLTSVEIINESSDRDTAGMSGLAHQGRFKALTELVPGENKIVVRAGGRSLAFRLNYEPQTNPYVVRAVYAVDSSGDTTYQTPYKEDKQDYEAKLGTMMIMMQSFTAERMYDCGYGRTTFNLEYDEAGKVKVHVLRLDRPAEYSYGLTRGALSGYLNSELKAKLPHPKAKNLVIPAFSRFDPVTKVNKAYTALGGGNQALFGGSNMYAWPDSIREIQEAFMDSTPIDRANYCDDSYSHHVMWANVSTPAGACLHELGHAFGLPHVASRRALMYTGLDRFSRAFVVVEAPDVHRGEPLEFSPEEIVRFLPANADFLKYSPWFAMEDKAYRGSLTKVSFDWKTGNVTVASPHGIGGVVVGASGVTTSCVPIDGNQPLPVSVLLDPAEWADQLDARDASIRTVDAYGNQDRFSVRDLRGGSSVRDWHFSSKARERDEGQAFPEMGGAKRKAIIEDALGNALAPSSGRWVSLSDQYPGEERARVVGYAARRISCEKSRTVLLEAFSGDSLRVWVNDELVVERAERTSWRSPPPPEEVEFEAGENTLLLEVGKGGRFWGMGLSLSDPQGRDTRLTEAGHLEIAPALTVQAEGLAGRGDLRFGDRLEISMMPPFEEGEIRYTLDGQTPAPDSPAYRGPFSIDDTKTLKARYFNQEGEPEGWVISRTFRRANYEKNITTGKPVEVPETFSDSAVDGFADIGDAWKVHKPNYLDEDRELVIDLEEPTVLGKLHVFTFWAKGLSYQYTCSLSSDGENWTRVVDMSRNTDASTPDGDVHRFEPAKARYIKVTALKNNRNNANSPMHIVEVRAYPPPSGSS